MQPTRRERCSPASRKVRQRLSAGDYLFFSDPCRYSYLCTYYPGGLESRPQGHLRKFLCHRTVRTFLSKRPPGRAKSELFRRNLKIPSVLLRSDRRQKNLALIPIAGGPPTGERLDIQVHRQLHGHVLSLQAPVRLCVRLLGLSTRTRYCETRGLDDVCNTTAPPSRDHFGNLMD